MKITVKEETYQGFKSPPKNSIKMEKTRNNP
jgi:hypothetical protein